MIFTSHENYKILWVLSILCAIFIHLGVIFYFQNIDLGAKDNGIEGIDIGLGSQGQNHGQISEFRNLTDQLNTSVPNKNQKPKKLSEFKKETTEIIKKPEIQKKVKIQKKQQSKKSVITNSNPLIVNVKDENTDVPSLTKTAGKTKQVIKTTNKGISGINGKSQMGIGDDSKGGGKKGDIVNYFNLLKKQIQSHQKYPLKAKRLKQHGTAMVKFVITEHGQLLYVTVIKTSGYPLLDNAAIAAIKNASPLLPIPNRFKKKIITVIIPMQFILT